MKIITLPCICLNDESVFTDTAEKLFEDRFLSHFLKYIFGFTSFLYYKNLVLSKDKSNAYSDFLNISKNFIYLLILFIAHTFGAPPITAATAAQNKQTWRRWEQLELV